MNENLSKFLSSLSSDRGLTGQPLGVSLNAETSGVVLSTMGSLALLGLGDSKPKGDRSFIFSKGFYSERGGCLVASF